MGLVSFFFIVTTVPMVQNLPESVHDWEILCNDVLLKNVDEAGRIDFAS